MKILEFIKMNVSVFSVVGVLLLLLFLIYFNNYERTGSERDIALLFSFMLIPISILFFLFYFLTKKCIYSRLKLNLFQFLILITISLITYYQYFQICQD